MSREDPKNSAVSACNLSVLHLTLGWIDTASAVAERSVEYADQSGYAFGRMSSRTALANAVCQAGGFDRAREHVSAAERLIQQTGYHRRDGELERLIRL